MSDSTLIPAPEAENTAYHQTCAALLTRELLQPFNLSWDAVVTAKHFSTHEVRFCTQTRFAEKPHCAPVHGKIPLRPTDVAVAMPDEGNEALKAWMHTGKAERTALLAQRVLADFRTTLPGEEVTLDMQRRFLWHHTCHACEGSTKVDCPRCKTKGIVTCPTCKGVKTTSCGKCGGSGSNTCWNCSGRGKTSCLSCSGSGRTHCYMCHGNGQTLVTRYDSQGNQQSDYEICYYCSGGTNPCSVCNGEGEGSCPPCSGSGSITCRPCRGSGRITCSGCDGKGTVTCPDCNGSGSIPCVTCGATGSLTAIWQCLYASDISTTLEYPPHLADSLKNLLEQCNLTNTVATLEQQSLRHTTRHTIDSMDCMRTERCLQLPTAVFTLQLNDTQIHCLMLGTQPYIVNSEHCKQALMTYVLARLTAFLDANRLLLPALSWLFPLFRTLLHIPHIREQMQKTVAAPNTRPDRWEVPFRVLSARIRRLFLLPAFLPALVAMVLPVESVTRGCATAISLCTEAFKEVGIFFATATVWMTGVAESQTTASALAIVGTAASATGDVFLWAWDTLWAGLAHIDTAMAESGRLACETWCAAMYETASQVAITAKAWLVVLWPMIWAEVEKTGADIATGLFTLEAVARHTPLWMILLMWGWLFPWVASVLCRGLFLGFESALGGWLYVRWVRLRLPRAPILPLLLITVISLFVCYCALWLFG